MVFFDLLDPQGLFLGLGSVSKSCFGSTNVEYQFWLQRYSPNFVFLVQPHLAPSVLEFQPIFFVLNSFPFGPFLNLFLGPLSFLGGPVGAIFGVEVRLKTFLRQFHVDYQIQFWKQIPIFLFLIRPHFGPFLPFLGPQGLFLGLDSTTFLGPTYID